MAKILWLNWSGGGNLPPSLGIARMLAERGHEVVFAGRPEMVDRVESAGFRAIELTRAYACADRYPQDTPLGRLACYLTSDPVGDQVRQTISAERPDVLAIDAMFPVALDAAAETGLPSIVFFHHPFLRLRETWRDTGAHFEAMRERAGFAPLPSFEELWKRQDRIVVTSPAAFDSPAGGDWEGVRHAGPVLEDERCAAPIELPWAADDSRPLVLISFSSAPEQRSVEKFRRSLDALADLPVRVVATTAGVADPIELSSPSNAIVVAYAAQNPILQQASLAITHGGHGTLMRALRYGVPMIFLPGLAHDQMPNAQFVAAAGAGIALQGDAPAEEIQKAARAILATPSYRQAAREFSARCGSFDGAAHAAGEVEALMQPPVAAP